MPDPAEAVLVHVIRSMRRVFSPTAEIPPAGGGSDYVRLFAGDGIPLAAWNAHSESCGCGEPFLWVRLLQRYKTTANDFPAPVIRASNCAWSTALEIELGAARCAVVDEAPTWKQWEDEASIHLDDSWRVGLAQCHAAACMGDDALKTSSGPVLPYGPEGGVIGVYGTMWVML